MLARFLLIGVGGSGGKTLRILRREALSRLSEAGYDGPPPRGWQFLHIDIPQVPDGDEPDLPGQLPAGSYVPLSRSRMSYRQVDEFITRGATKDMLEHVAGWRPDPRQMNVNPRIAGGQYRATGRVIAAGGMREMVDALRRAVDALSGEDVQAEMENISLKVGDDRPESPEPWAIIVSSMGGGSGAGTYLDVCDAVRLLGMQVNEPWLDQSIAVLYAPDLFDELPEAKRAGIPGNTLASIAELLAGRWNNEDTDDVEFALLKRAGLDPQGAPMNQRGPAYPFIVSRSNQTMTFATQNDTYRAVGRALTNWLTDYRLQDKLRQSIAGNWQSSATVLQDNTGFTGMREKPVASFGFASVGLGRHRFEQYATEQLAGACIKVLLWGHRDPNERSRSAVVDQARETEKIEAIGGFFWEFEGFCGLQESTERYNDILDAIRGGPVASARSSKLRELLSAILKSTTSGKTSTGIDGTRAPDLVFRGVQERQDEFIQAESERELANARKWVEEISSLVLRATERSLGTYGGPGTSQILKAVIEDLDQNVVRQLNQEAVTHERAMSNLLQRIRSALGAFRSGQIRVENPVLEKAVREGVDTVFDRCEAELRYLVIRLIQDFVKNFLKPLRDAVDRGVKSLGESIGADIHASRWLESHVPAEYVAGKTEVVLDESDNYRSDLTRYLAAGIGMDADRPDDIIARTVEHLVGGPPDTDWQSGVLRHSGFWQPSLPELRMGAPKRAAIESSFSPDDLLAMARRWMKRPGTPLRAFIDEDLNSYLNPAGPEHAARLQNFVVSFRQALELAMPFAEVDGVALSLFHGQNSVDPDRHISEIPFPEGPSHDRVFEVLRRMEPQSRTNDEIETYFGDPGAKRIEITTFMALAVHPMVLKPIIAPVSKRTNARSDRLDDFWLARRARPLKYSVPLPPAMRAALARGWFTGRLLGQIELDRQTLWSQPIKIWIPGEGLAAFPFPLLSSGISMSDAFAIVVESFSLALVQAAFNDRSLKAYRRLRDLGTAAVGVSGGPHPELETRLNTGLHPEFEIWLNEGKTDAPNAPSPIEVVGSTVEERFDSAEAWVKKYIDHFAGIDVVPENADAALTVGPGWELRHDILAALGHIQEAVVGARGRILDSGVG